MEKVYMYFCKSNEDNAPYFYGFTNDKYINKKFKEQRNEKLFTEIVKEMTREEYKNFEKKYNSLILREVELVTKKEEEEGLNYYGRHKEETFVSVIMTSSEEMDVFVKSDSVFENIMKSDFVDTRIFNEKLQYLIEDTFHYTTCYNMYMSMNGIMLRDIKVDWDSGGYLPFKDYVVDQLAVFLYLYGYTLKTK